MVGLIVVAWGVGDASRRRSGEPPPPVGRAVGAAEPPSRRRAARSAEPPSRRRRQRARRRPCPAAAPQVFGGNHFLVAYYGTGQTGALGVLGETRPGHDGPPRCTARRAPFRRPGQPVRHVYELIVTIADRAPGPGRRLQPRHPARARSTATSGPRTATTRCCCSTSSPAAPASSRWPSAGSGRCATRGSAWRSTPSGGWVRARCPAHTVGSGRAPSEVNRTSAWLRPADRARRPAAEALRAAPVPGRHGRATSAGSSSGPGWRWSSTSTASAPRGRSSATYHAVARPRQFTMGFKLFYDEDVRRMQSRAVHAVRPRVRFVSFQ